MLPKTATLQQTVDIINTLYHQVAELRKAFDRHSEQLEHCRFQADRVARDHNATAEAHAQLAACVAQLVHTNAEHREDVAEAYKNITALRKALDNLDTLAETIKIDLAGIKQRITQ